MNLLEIKKYINQDNLGTAITDFNDSPMENKLSFTDEYIQWTNPTDIEVTNYNEENPRVKLWYNLDDIYPDLVLFVMIEVREGKSISINSFSVEYEHKNGAVVEVSLTHYDYE